MKTSIIQLDSHDDVHAIRDKLSWSKTNRILLVWPVKPLSVQRLDLVLILRACQQHGAQLAFVTDDRDISLIAQELNIPVFDSLNRANSKSWRRVRGKRLPIQIDHNWRKPEKPSVLLVGNWQNHRIVRFTAAGLGAAAVLILVLIFIPSATVNLFPLRESQTLNMQVRPNLNLNTVNVSGGVPASIVTITVEAEETRASTGSMVVPGNYSVGRANFTNLTEEVVIIPKGVFVASSGYPSIRYQTTESVELPGKVNSKIDVRIQAVNPGKTGNVPAGTIQSVEGALGGKVSVNNPDAIIGGSDNIAATPSASDREILRETLLFKLRANAIDELKKKIGEDHILEQSVSLKQIQLETSEPEKMAPSETLRILIRAEYQAWVVRSRDLKDLAQRSLDTTLPDKRIGLNETLIINPTDDLKFEKEIGTWSVTFSRETEEILDKPIITLLVRGKTVENATAQLENSYTFQRSPEIELDPGWWPILPILTFRITVSP